MNDDNLDEEKTAESDDYIHPSLSGEALFEGTPITPEDRPRGILSKVDREFLCGQKEYEHSQSEANRRQDIRERVSNSLQDFVLLAFLLSEDEREQLIQQINPDDLDIELSAMISFMYLCIDQDEDHLEKIIERGVLWGANDQRGSRWSGEATEVETSIDITYNPNVNQIYDKYTEGDTEHLTPAEIGVLVRSGKLTAEDLDRLKITGRNPFDRD